MRLPKLPTIPHDKALHAIYGYWVFTATVCAGLLLLPAEFAAGVSVGAAAGITVAAAVGREMWQVLTRTGKVCQSDVWATVAGGAAGALAVGLGFLASGVYP